jgi:beta-glucanase (GH16 family)
MLNQILLELNLLFIILITTEEEIPILELIIMIFTKKFYTYSLVWTKEALTFYVEDKPHHIVGNSCALPFNWDFNIILNFAMGGTLGGEIDSSFTSETMEIDYVKVYQ